jgi:hypothetical protein
MRSIRTAVAVTALAAAVVLAGCKADGRAAPSATAGSPAVAAEDADTVAGGAPATTSTTPLADGGTTARGKGRPGPAEAVETALADMRREVGMTAPGAGPFRSTGADTGQVEVHPGLRDGHQPWRNGPVTVVSLKRLATTWYVVSARTHDIQVSAPSAGQAISSPVRVAGRALAFEGTVQVKVTQDRYGQDLLLGKGIVTGGGDVLRPYSGQITFRSPSAASGSVILYEVSEADGVGVLSATVVRVRLARTAATGAACTSRALLPLLKRTFDGTAPELVVAQADIRRCRNGYAHVFAVPRRNPAGHPQYDAEQLFLRDVKGSWRIVDSGTGISCEDNDLTAALRQACRALGYRA